MPNNGYLVTAHHLNDVVEGWIWSSMHGEGKIIEPEQSFMTDDGNLCYLIRPFLLSKKREDGRAIQFIDKPSKELQLAAVNQNGNVSIFLIIET